MAFIFAATQGALKINSMNRMWSARRRHPFLCLHQGVFINIPNNYLSNNWWLRYQIKTNITNIECSTQAPFPVPSPRRLVNMLNDYFSIAWISGALSCAFTKALNMSNGYFSNDWYRLGYDWSCVARLQVGAHKAALGWRLTFQMIISININLVMIGRLLHGCRWELMRLHLVDAWLTF